MKLDVPYKIVTTIPETIIQDIISSIDDPDWFVKEYRNGLPSMKDTNSIPIMHPDRCWMNRSDNQIIREIQKQPLHDKFYPKIEPILEILSRFYKYRQYSAFITRCAPKGKVGIHRDAGNFLEKCHRIHIPLLTHEDALYVINDERVHWKHGHVYEFDNTLPHGVENNSNIYRIHLIINLYNLTDEELMYG